MGSRKFEVGQRVRVTEGYEDNWTDETDYFGDPSGLEGIVMGYENNYEYPVWVELTPEPDGATDAVRYFYPDLFRESELEVVE